MKSRFFHFLIRASLVLVLMIVLAGSVVRMTGSGMGCPDWPKCFGLLIPPTQDEQVAWKPDTEFTKHRMIVHDEKLWRAKETFTTGSTLDLENWEEYTRHDYAKFNALHTWTEYINRLIGALSGIPVLLVFVLSWLWYARQIKIPIVATLSLFTLLFAAWLGKVVVDGNLIPGQITLHMATAMLLVILLILLLHLHQSIGQERGTKVPRDLLGLLVLLMAVFLAQIILGTQVREQVDKFGKELSYMPRQDWVTAFDWKFYVHRSTSLLILILAFFAHHRAKANGIKIPAFNLVLALIIIEIISGASLAYLGLPKFLQPFHLLASTIIMGLIWYGILRLRYQKKAMPLHRDMLA